LREKSSTARRFAVSLRPIMATKRQRIVFKFGSGILTTQRGNALDLRQFRRLAAEISALVKRGHECVIVSSGAVAAGLHALDLTERPADLSARQSCAAVGQPRLMVAYQKAFAPHGVTVAQLLLTHGDRGGAAACARHSHAPSFF
jgi:glutamate 5-kinase